MRKMGAVLVALALCGCWQSGATVNYDRHHAYTEFPPEAYRQIAGVSGSSTTHYTGFCQAAAEDALAEAAEAGRRLGGNALAKVKWIYDGQLYDHPRCEAGFWIYWWGGRAQVQATAIIIDPAALPATPATPATP